MKAKTQQSILILHDIRSAENVGSLFRTADAAGISTIYLSAITPTPLDKFNRPNSKIAKTALGAEQTLNWKLYTNYKTLFKKLRAEGFTIIAIEQSPEAVSYRKVRQTSKMVFVLGNEVTGIPAEMLSLVDTIAEIPLKGSKESLNVSVAGGIALFQILRI